MFGLKARQNPQLFTGTLLTTVFLMANTAYALYGRPDLVTVVDSEKRSPEQHSVTLLVIKSKDGMRSCTGTYLSSSVVVTTADCVRGSESVHDYFRNAKALEHIIMQDVVLGKVPEDRHVFDLALVKFETDTYKGKVWSLSFDTAEEDVPTIYSYGKPFDNEKRPVFRSAELVVDRYDSYHYESSDDPVIVAGDQGAPIVDEGGNFIGIASRGTSPNAQLSAKDILAGRGINYYTRIGADKDFFKAESVSKYLEFYKTAIGKGYEVPSVLCSCDGTYDDGLKDTFTAHALKAKLKIGSVCRLYENQRRKLFGSTVTLSNCRES